MGKNLYVDDSLEQDIERLRETILEKFGMDPGIVGATKIISWKNRTNKTEIDADKLRKILGGK